MADHGNKAPMPLNSITRSGLRRLELVVFCAIVLGASTALAWRGVQLVMDRSLSHPLFWWTLPEPMGVLAGGVMLALAGVIAVADLAMFFRFMR